MLRQHLNGFRLRYTVVQVIANLGKERLECPVRSGVPGFSTNAVMRVM